ncbi:hypothetical protein Anapl_07139 [Anas platyrhynchos]|uniref:Uncharacterized protein n=1 Tax=Anas platyrhynchos TaxID=8839 RepID=R0LG79_ANAPL|nr:hypothetical protein Anapl_07139 [Anas platyrhynchos]
MRSIRLTTTIEAPGQRVNEEQQRDTVINPCVKERSGRTALERMTWEQQQGQEAAGQELQRHQDQKKGFERRILDVHSSVEASLTRLLPTPCRKMPVWAGSDMDKGPDAGTSFPNKTKEQQIQQAHSTKHVVELHHHCNRMTAAQAATLWQLHSDSSRAGREQRLEGTLLGLAGNTRKQTTERKKIQGFKDYTQFEYKLTCYEIHISPLKGETTADDEMFNEPPHPSSMNFSLDYEGCTRTPGEIQPHHQVRRMAAMGGRPTGVNWLLILEHRYLEMTTEVADEKEKAEAQKTTENVPGTYKIKDVHTLNNEQIPTLILHQGGNVQAEFKRSLINSDITKLFAGTDNIAEK